MACTDSLITNNFHKASTVDLLTHARRFNSSIFTIVAGDTGHVFAAHETVLSQSPVLARFCKSQFREATDKKIVLPDESVQSVGRLLEYLYSGDYACGGCEKPFDEALELAGMYIIADKYNLERLKVITMNKLIAFTDFPTERMEFFQLADLVYKHVPDSDRRFRDYFAFFAPLHITAMQESEMRQLQEMMKVGGIFAQDAFSAQTQAWSNKMEGAKRVAEEELASAVPSKKAKPGGTPTSATRTYRSKGSKYIRLFTCVESA